MTDSRQPDIKFFSDLDFVYQAEFVDGLDADLLRLAKSFDSWRAHKRLQVVDYLVALPPDDPLLCPVSLLGTIQQGRLETAHTKALAWLLDPRQGHGFGDALLKALLIRLTSHSVPAGFSVEWVESEYPALAAEEGEDGYLDVIGKGSWAVGGKPTTWVLVIEAKIDHTESEGQLAKYDSWLAAHYREVTVIRVFLTVDGRRAETGDTKWQPLSFLELVNVFRPVLPQFAQTAGLPYLRYYLAGVLRDVCQCPLHVTADCTDPYTLLKYLQAASGQKQEARR